MDQKRLFIGNLPYKLDDEQLEKLFAEFGTVVSAKVITDKYSGRSKGFGFVEFETEDEAKKAVEALNEKEVEGRNIVVNVARPREDRPRREE